jgi:AcrR family transcriptional regulator
MSSPSFQRARRPEQVEERREAIVAAARDLLSERPLHEVTLRSLGERAGIATSGLLRYFDSREAIFVEVLRRSYDEWLDGLTGSMARLEIQDEGHSRAVAVAHCIADSISSRPQLCDLISASAAILEHNISLELAREFKSQTNDQLDRFAGLAAAALPRLDAEAAGQFAMAVVVITAGLWPLTRTSETMAQVKREQGHGLPSDTFADTLREGLANQLVGLIVRGEV